eukprot:CAMPEP_0182858002 /NCGR_PEP_ID=MMETSP0034_2-20130328/3398_1 /TAXON_ID=156128 /ORGANISM="Nephroselmis pyriformis, Strain CCMP717" /LENGTH=197 /DNA_ID=CAMNT_0024989331 /DNA_START=99 /DNA_END=692 /DNA_ORIENTATION=-
MVAAAAIAAGATLVPLAVPRIRTGFGRIVKAYKGQAPIKPQTNAEAWGGEFPEYDFTGASLQSHLMGGFAAAFAGYLAAAKQAELLGWNDPLVHGLAALSAAFALDGISHSYVAGAPKGSGKDNVMQKGHKLDMIPLMALAAFAYTRKGFAKLPSLYTPLPAGPKWMLFPRAISHPFVLGPTLVWQSLQALGVFGAK